MMISELYIDPKRFVVSNQSRIDYYVGLYNGKKHLYQTLYNYIDEPTNDQVLVDRIYLDFDVQDEGFFEDVRTIAKYLYDNDIMFCIRFSGRGFHIFIFLDKKWLKSPKLAIKKYVRDLHKKTDTYSDPSVIGDLRRVVRMPNTINLKSNKYCIAITYDMLMENDYDFISEVALNKGPCYDYINGSQLLDISEWDQEVRLVQTSQSVSTEVKLSNEFPPCITEMMKDHFLGYRSRFMLIVFLRDMGYTRDEIDRVLQSFLDEEKYIHCIHQEDALKYLVDDERYCFPDCHTIKIEGLCYGKDCEGPGLYY